MSARKLLAELRLQGVRLWLEGGRVHYRGPGEVLTQETLERMREHKSSLLKLLKDEERRDRERWARGVDPRWSRHKGYIRLHDPATGEIHELRREDCPESIIQDANRARRKDKEGA